MRVAGGRCLQIEELLGDFQNICKNALQFAQADAFIVNLCSRVCKQKAFRVLLWPRSDAAGATELCWAMVWRPSGRKYPAAATVKGNLHKSWATSVAASAAKEGSELLQEDQ